MLSISNPHKLADFIELFILTTKKDFSVAQFRSYLSDYFYNNDEELDYLVDSVWLELKQREILYGVNSPIKVEDFNVVPIKFWDNFPELFLCLFFAYFGAENNPKGTKLFELISSEAAKNYLAGESAVLGFPNKIKLNDQISEIANKQNERRGLENPPRRAKDRGVDLIAWKPHGDKRDNQVVMLLQCAAGKEYKNKKPVPFNSWTHYISWRVQPLIGITIPIIITNHELWDTISGDYNLIFDRVRIFRGLIDFPVNMALRKEVIKWSKNKITKVKQEIMSL